MAFLMCNPLDTLNDLSIAFRFAVTSRSKTITECENHTAGRTCIGNSTDNSDEPRQLRPHTLPPRTMFDLPIGFPHGLTEASSRPATIRQSVGPFRRIAAGELA